LIQIKFRSPTYKKFRTPRWALVYFD
jgi:hypothetical protein